MRRPLKLPQRVRWNSRRTWCGVIGDSSPFVALFGMSGCLEGGGAVLHPWGLEKLCPQFTVDFKVFDLTKKLSYECLKCLELAKVGLDKLEEADIDSAEDDW